MDFSEASARITNITSQISDHKEKLEVTKDKYVIKINKLLNELEHIVNFATTKSPQYVEIQVNKKLKKIDDTIKSMNTKLNEIVNQSTIWYNTAIINIKRNTIKSVGAKMGIDVTNEMSDALAESIPHPTIEPLLPEIKLNIELPDLSNLSEIGQISIPRLKI